MAKRVCGTLVMFLVLVCGACDFLDLGPEPATIIIEHTVVSGMDTMNGFTGDNGLAINALLDEPFGIAVDSESNLYIADKINNRIRKVDRRGVITTLLDEDILSGPVGLTLDEDDLYIANHDKHNVVVLNLTTLVSTTVAGMGSPGPVEEGREATRTKLTDPWAIVLDENGNFIFTDTDDDIVRKVNLSTGSITAFAGTGIRGNEGNNGPADSAQVARPTGIAIDQIGNVYFAERTNGLIRRVDGLTGVITTILGADSSSAETDDCNRLNLPSGLAINDEGILFIADRNNHRICSLNTVTGEVFTFFSDPDSVSRPTYITLDGPDLYYADQARHTVTRIRVQQ